jgi:hypothetical protein
MKRTKMMISWTIRLAVLTALAYFLRPLYAPPKSTLPASRGANDFVSWTFLSDTNAAVYQKLTLYGDGRNVIQITRSIGDPDLPEMNVNWKVKRDKATGLSLFIRESFLKPDKAKELLNAALEAGAIDLQPEPSPDSEWLEIQTSFGGTHHNAMGPQFVSTPVAARPNVWINRIRWQKIGNLISGNSELRSILSKKQVILVNDDGKEVK